MPSSFAIELRKLLDEAGFAHRGQIKEAAKLLDLKEPVLRQYLSQGKLTKVPSEDRVQHWLSKLKIKDKAKWERRLLAALPRNQKKIQLPDEPVDLNLLGLEEATEKIFKPVEAWEAWCKKTGWVRSTSVQDALISLINESTRIAAEPTPVTLFVSVGNALNVHKDQTSRVRWREALRAFLKTKSEGCKVIYFVRLTEDRASAEQAGTLILEFAEFISNKKLKLVGIDGTREPFALSANDFAFAVHEQSDQWIGAVDIYGLDTRKNPDLALLVSGKQQKTKGIEETHLDLFRYKLQHLESAIENFRLPETWVKAYPRNNTSGRHQPYIKFLEEVARLDSGAEGLVSYHLNVPDLPRDEIIQESQSYRSRFLKALLLSGKPDEDFVLELYKDRVEELRTQSRRFGTFAVVPMPVVEAIAGEAPDPKQDSSLAFLREMDPKERGAVLNYWIRTLEKYPRFKIAFTRPMRTPERWQLASFITPLNTAAGSTEYVAARVAYYNAEAKAKAKEGAVSSMYVIIKNPQIAAALRELALKLARQSSTRGAKHPADDAGNKDAIDYLRGKLELLETSLA